MGMPPQPTSLVLLVIRLYARNTFKKNTQNRKEAIKGKLFRRFDLDVTLTLFGSVILSDPTNIQPHVLEILR